MSKWDKFNKIANDKRAAYEPSKIVCLICKNRWYHKIGAHIRETHEMTAREYREKFNLEVKRGIVSNVLREKLKNNALINHMDKQLIKAGNKTRFKKGQKGLGKYKRSPITIARLKVLYKYNSWHK